MLMPASNISRMLTPFSTSSQHAPVQGWLSLYTSLSSTVDSDESIANSGLICSSTPITSPLAMLFNAKDRKPNLLNDRQSNFKKSPSLTITTGPSGDECPTHNSTRPLPLAPHDRYYDLNSFSSEDFSFTANPNDVTSLASSDWGDEACEIDRQKSHCVQLLFNAIDQILFEPGCLKKYNSNDHPNFSPDTQKENLKSSAHPESVDLNSVRNLLPECKEWASKFPHFRLQGIQIHPPPPPQSPSPSLTNQRSSIHQQYLQKRSTGRQPEVPRRVFKSPEVSKMSQVKNYNQAGVEGQQFGSALVVQGQRIPTSRNTTTTWLNHPRVNRGGARFQAGALNTRTPSDLVNSKRNLHSTPPEETGFERGRRRLKTSKSPHRPASQWLSHQATTSRSPQRTVYISNRATKSRDPALSREALSRTLVEMLLAEALTALKESPPHFNRTLSNPRAVGAKLTKSLSNLSSRELESEKGSRLSVTPDQLFSSKTPPSSRNSQRRSPELPQNLVLSGKSFHILTEPGNSATTISSFSSNTLVNENRNAQFSITWPVRPDIPKSRLDSSNVSPINHARLNIPDRAIRPQANSTLPPIVMPKAANQTFTSYQRRRIARYEVALLPSIFNPNSDGENNYHYSTKVMLHHGDSVGQTTLVEHSSKLPQSGMNNSLSQSFEAKIPPYSSKSTQIQYSVAISTQRKGPTDSIWSNNEQTGDRTQQPQSQQRAPEKKPEKTINKRLQRTQAQVNEVVDIMRVNIEKVLERDKNLSQLDDRADALQAGASQFEASAGKLKRKFWWRNCKLLMVLCGILAVIAIVIIVALTSEKRETSTVNGSRLLNSNMTTSLSSELSPFGENEVSQGHPLREPEERQGQAQRSSPPAYSGSPSNRVFPHGEEAILSFPPALSHQNSPLPESKIASEALGEGTNEGNSMGEQGD